jgi:alcohol dehydrogenase class IV
MYHVFHTGLQPMNPFMFRTTSHIVYGFSAITQVGMLTEIPSGARILVAGDQDLVQTGIVRQAAEQLVQHGTAVLPRDVGIPLDAIPALAADAMKQARLLVNNPRMMPLADATAIDIAAG